MIASALELHRLATKRKSRVVTALTMLKTHLFKYQGHVGAALVLGENIGTTATALLASVGGTRNARRTASIQP